MIISITHPPRQLWTWEYYRQNRTIKLDFMRRQWQALERFWKSDQKSTLITGFWTCNEHGMSRGSKPVHIGDLHMGLISRLHQTKTFPMQKVGKLIPNKVPDQCWQVISVDMRKGHPSLSPPLSLT